MLFFPVLDHVLCLVFFFFHSYVKVIVENSEYVFFLFRRVSLSVSVSGSFAFFIIFVQVLMLISAFFLLLFQFSPIWQKVSFTEI